MDKHEIYAKLSESQKAAVGKIGFQLSKEFEKIANEVEISLFFQYLSNKMREIAENRAMKIRGEI